MKVLTWDLECKENPAIGGWKNYEAMGISFGCFHTDWDGKLHVFDEGALGDLTDAMQEADLITGFNILGFDFPLLFAIWRLVRGKAMDDILRSSMLRKAYDVLADIRETAGNPFLKGWKLDNVAKANLKAQKSGDGADAPGLWKSGRHDELCSYVKQDVVVERELFEVCRDTGVLVNPGFKPDLLKLVQAKRLFPKLAIPAAAAI